MIWVVIVIVAIVVIGLLLLVAAYNRLVRYRNAATNAWAQVEVQLKRRHDLIPNLVETVKGSDLLHGLLSFGVYAVIFCSIAWARFTSTDVTA